MDEFKYVSNPRENAVRIQQATTEPLTTNVDESEKLLGEKEIEFGSTDADFAVEITGIRVPQMTCISERRTVVVFKGREFMLMEKYFSATEAEY